MSRLVRRVVCLVVVVALCAAMTGAAFAAGCGGGGPAKGSEGWAEAQSSANVKGALLTGRSVEKAAVAMNEAKQADAAATPGRGEKDERLARLAREVLELAKQYEELAGIAGGKLAATKAAAESAVAAGPVEYYKSKLDSMTEKVKLYKEQAQALIS